MLLDGKCTNVICREPEHLGACSGNARLPFKKAFLRKIIILFSSEVRDFLNFWSTLKLYAWDKAIYRAVWNIGLALKLGWCNVNVSLRLNSTQAYFFV